LDFAPARKGLFPVARSLRGRRQRLKKVVRSLLEVLEAAGQILLFRIRPVFPGKIRQLTLEADHFTELRLVVYLDVDDLLLLHFFRRRHEANWNDIRETIWSIKMVMVKLPYGI
jgi:hypothetical protein